MKIELKEKFKSLHPFVSDELSDFCVITGKNGSGKSQLISIMRKDELTDKEGIEVSYSEGIKPTAVYINKMDRTLSVRGTNTNYRPVKQAENLLSSYKQLGPNTKVLISALVNEGVDFSNFSKKLHSDFEDKPIYNLLFSKKPDIQKLVIDAANELGYLKSDRSILTDIYCRDQFFYSLLLL